jgi:type VI secretion system protein ImpG
MDRAFLDRYEEELGHIRGLAAEFADMHPTVARNLSLDTVPCADPYVERLLEGVAFIAARARLRLEGERERLARATLDALYPDLVAPTPAIGLVQLQPGPQVQTMLSGHAVVRGSRLVSALRPGLATRCVYVTAQDVTLWPVEIRSLAYLQDRGAMAASGVGGVGGHEPQAALRLTIGRVGPGALAELDLDRLDIHLRDRAKAPRLFDAIFGACPLVAARPEGRESPLAALGAPAMIGIGDDEALFPRTRPTFEGFRLLREYFAAPERFHFVRVEGLRPVVRRTAGTLEIVFPLLRPAPELADIAPSDVALFVAPVVNLFERDCATIETDARRTAQAVHADRARPRDFEIYRLTRVEDAAADGAEAALGSVFSLDAGRARWRWSGERRPRRPTEDERRQGQLRTSYAGDDLFLSLCRDDGAGPPPRRLDIRALCTNRDLPLIDDTPTLTLETGDPVAAIRLLGAIRPPRPALAVAAPAGPAADARADEAAWRLVAQLSLNFLSLAEGGEGAAPLAAVLGLYADRGDPALARHVRAVAGVSSRTVTERLPLAGPVCYGRGVEITLEIDERPLAGASVLLLPALLARLFARYAAINAFVRVRARLVQRQEEVAWPMTPGARPPI